ncbi:MAG TPA: peptidoglycan-N-acetylglucosamine deacetylase [Anaerolineales bacterium]|nr:peptidoglycan-N-acetylglucosamine deacetylase [Anaerolineae bacterium]HIQ00682.1 peptidoglycan-N-acetylglucosamine deacetylase [Anaerolineales bacterium]
MGLVSLAFLLVVSTALFLRPGWIVAALAKAFPDVVYFVETREPVVALTIDDGPDAVATARILSVLRRYDARATFFLISGYIPGNEAVVARIVEEGHEIANHLTADRPSILLEPAEFERELVEAHEILSGFSDVRWFRPGSGWYNRAMLSTLQEHGYRCVLGSVYPFDPQIPSAWFAAHYVLWNVRPGAVIVLHDRGGRGERTAVALATILAELDRRGFRVVTLSELVGSTRSD